MKKILSLLILLPLMAISQIVPADATALENIQITNNTTSLTAPFVTVQETNGVINKINKADLVNVVEVNDVPSLPLIGEVGKIYVVKTLNKIYRWNGTFYQELSFIDISGKANLNSPNFTGVPAAPTAAAGTDSNQIATTAFVAGGLATKENAFTKNTAFNKNFGTTVGTVVEGNDSRILNGQTAFSWGNHAGLYSTITGSNINQASFRSALGLGSNAYSSTPYLPLSGGTVTGMIKSGGFRVDGDLVVSNGVGFEVYYNPVDKGVYLQSYHRGVDDKYYPMLFEASSFSFNAPTTIQGTVTASPATASNHLVTKAQLDASVTSRPYRVYTVLLTQSGAFAPTATVLENTLGGTVVWSRNSVGAYLGTLANGFSSTLSKVRIFISGGEPSQNPTGFYNALPNDINSVQVNTRNTSGSLADSLMSAGATIEIRVYN